MEKELDRLQRRYDNGKISDNQLLGEIGKIEDKIRVALKINQVRLQSSDPHWSPRK